MDRESTVKSALILFGMAAFAVITSPRGRGEDTGAPASVPVAPLPGIGPAKAAADDFGVPASVRVDVQMVSVPWVKRVVWCRR